MPYVPGPVVHGVVHVADVWHSSNVFANFVPIALWQDAQGAEAAVMKEITSPNFAANQSMGDLDGEEDPAVVDRGIQAAIANETITQADVNKGNNPTVGSTDLSTGTVTSATVTATTVSGTEFPDTYVLYSSSYKTYTIGDLTKQPGVVFPHQVTASGGLTLEQVVGNLQLLVANCIDPIHTYRASLPINNIGKKSDMFITNSFRPSGIGSPTSQHPKGMACDIQFCKASKGDYFTIAQWIRDNVAFDQLLLEYKTTGSGMPWIHLSFNIDNNRHQIMTFMNDKKHSDGLVDLSAT